MSVAKVVEISASSKSGFEAAIQKGVDRVAETVDGVTGAWIKEMKVNVEDGKVSGYNVHMKVTFVIKKK